MLTFADRDIAEVQTAEGKLYLFVAIDRTPNLAFALPVEMAGKMAAAQFLRDLLKALPYHIHTVLTDNGIQFTNQKRHRFAGHHIFERVCADVHESMAGGAIDFVLLDVRGPNAFARGHIPGAQNLPYASMDAERMAEFPADSLFVVYCAGPHCNGANWAAIRFARLGLAVKNVNGPLTL